MDIIIGSLIEPSIKSEEHFSLMTEATIFELTKKSTG